MISRGCWRSPGTDGVGGIQSNESERGPLIIHCFLFKEDYSETRHVLHENSLFILTDMLKQSFGIELLLVGGCIAPTFKLNSTCVREEANNREG